MKSVPARIDLNFLLPGQDVAITYEPDSIEEAVNHLEDTLWRAYGPKHDGTLEKVTVTVHINRT